MFPKAKKILHECKYHLENLFNSNYFEEAEINFAAFVNSARNVTFVLYTDYSKHPEFKDRFKEWYGKIDEKETLCANCKKIIKKLKKEEEENNPKQGTKRYEMINDELCNFFHNLRNQIVKEGINKLACSIHIKSMNTLTDYPNKPAGSSTVINNKGVYFHIHKGTAKEDLIPAQSETTKIATFIAISDCPTQHLGQKIENPNLFTIAQLYYTYLENLVKEWTGIINNTN